MYVHCEFLSFVVPTINTLTYLLTYLNCTVVNHVFKYGILYILRNLLGFSSRFTVF